MFGTHEIHAPLPDNPIRDGTVRRDTHARRSAFLHIFGDEPKLRIAIEYGDSMRSRLPWRGHFDIVRSGVIRMSEIIRSELLRSLTPIMFGDFPQPTCYQHIFNVVLLRFRFEQVQ